MTIYGKENAVAWLGGVIFAFISIMLIVFLTYKMVVINERQVLAELADRVFARNKTVDNAVVDSLAAAEKFPRSIDCDQSLRQSLIRLVEEARYVKNIGILVGSNMLCTPVGIVETPLLSTRPDRPETDGYRVWYGGMLGASGVKENVITVAKDQVALSTHQDIYSDVILPDDVSVRIYDVFTNKIVSRKANQHPISDELLKQLVSEDLDAENDDFIFTSRIEKKSGIVAILSAPRTDIKKHWLESLWLWLPVSLILGVVAGLSFRNAILARFTPEQRLRHAIDNGEMKAFYQPIIDLQTRRCIGAEALVRWVKPDNSMVRPDLFIPLAEESGLVVPLTDAVLDEVVKDLGSLLANRDLYISINLSARDVAATRFLQLLTARLQQAAIPPHRIAIEATERGFLDAKASKASMAEYRNAGHRILIDDFGTGYSSLSYLQDLEVDVLKIDKSFVDTINADAVTSGVIPHIIAMAAQLNLKIVAEGVENEGQAKYLAEHGVQCGQGWLFAKAMPAEEFIAWLDSSDKAAL